jgi:hypothetical protein
MKVSLVDTFFRVCRVGHRVKDHLAKITKIRGQNLGKRTPEKKA